MIRSAAALFPASVYEPPPETARGAPTLNLNLGSVNVSLGGSQTGVYRRSGASENVVPPVDGIRDGVRNLMGKVRQGVDRIGIP
jgi:vacuolar protein sorting-associated protein 45